MADWYCYKDKVKMEKGGITLKYLEMIQIVPGIYCPKCQTLYLLEDTVMSIVKSAESILEGK
jgi:hypothetical protein